MTSTTSIQGEACNRLPFKSDENCDRGSVDIHMFNDIPLCKPIDPTMPVIPPEVVDTPAQLYVPPACTCFSMSYKTNIGYSGSRRFGGSGKMVSKGDCCEGKYESELDLSIPCPVVGSNSTLKVKLKQGSAAASAAATLMYANASACTVAGASPTLNLNLPCSVRVDETRMTVGVDWGAGPKSMTKTLVPRQREVCDVKMYNPEFRLNIPCPISDVEVDATVRYGRATNAKQTLLRKVGDCGLEGAPISLTIPCPIVGSGRNYIYIGARLGRGEYTGSRVLLSDKDATACTINMYSPDVKLDIPCPIVGSDPDLVKEFKKLNVKVKLKPPVQPGIPLPQSSSSAPVYMVLHEDECRIEPKNVDMELKIPCPLVKAADGNPKIKYRPAYSPQADGQYHSTEIMRIDSGCALVPLSPAEMNISIPCPVSQDYLKISKKYVPGTAFDVNLVEDGMDGCTRKLRLEVAQPQAGEGGCLEVVTDTRFEEKDGVMSAVNTKTDLCTGIQREDRVDLFSIGDMTVVTDVKYENTQFWQLRSKVKCLRRIEEVGDYIRVFETTPLSQE